MNHSSRDAGIPLLTEIISEPVAQNIPERKPAVERKQAALTGQAPEKQPIDALEADPRTDWIDEEWNRLEQTLRERILHQILARIDSVLEERIRDTLADILQISVQTLASDIRNGLQGSLEDAIARAVSEEINQLRAAKN